MTSRDCELCGALVARPLMEFHRDWHAHQEGRGRQFWEMSPSEPPHLVVIPRAALEASSPATARPEFVSDLRARLMAEAMSKPGPARPAPDQAPAT